jgi:ankyrin repeat protein
MCLEDLFKTLAGDPLDIRAALVQEKGNRVPGTCQWILTNPIYKRWLASQSQLLWLSGGPGKGKTMFAIFLTQELERLASQSTNVAVTFFFCGSSYRRNTAVDVIRGILFRLLISHPSLYQYIKRHYEIQKGLLFADSSLEPLWDIFEKVIRDTGLEAIYCVLDGLDECELSSLKILLSKLVSIFPKDSADAQRPKTRLKLLCISREYAECILEKLRTYPRIKLDPDSDKTVRGDLEQYISVKVDELSAEKDYSEEVRSLAKAKLMQRAGGTFLWVGFAVKELMDRASTEVEEALDNFPTGLEGLYSRMLLNVLERRRHVVALILRWVVIATRPLTVKELSIVTGVKAVRVEERERSIRDYISFCGPLLTVVNNEVHLVHASARDYLTRDEEDTDPVLEFFRIDEREAHATAAKLLLDTIQSLFTPKVAQDVLDSALPGWILASSVLEELDRTNPLTSYAVEEWAEHARRSCSHVYTFDVASSFFDETSSVREAWWSIYRHKKYDRRAPKSLSPLHLAAYFGLLPLAEKLLERAKSTWTGLSGLVNAKDSSGHSPLFYAASDGYEKMVQLLCERGITEADDGLRDTPLLIAISRRHSRVVDYLIEKGAKVDSGGGRSTPPLYLAASTGDESIVKALLHHGANTEAESHYDKETPLHVAARLGHQAVVKILLDKGASLRARTPQGRTALHLACIEGQAESARQLLANMKLKNQPWNERDNDQRTALHCALDFSSAPLHWLYENRRQTCLMILEFARSADVNAADKDGLTPLHLVVRSKDSDIVQKVLDCGGDHNARDRSGKLSVHHAAATRWWSNLDVITTLLRSFINDPTREQSHTSSLGENDANIGRFHNAEDVYKSRATNALQQRDQAGQTPLHIAAARGASHTVSLFLEYGVDVTIRDQENRTALDLAVRAQRQHTTEILSKRYIAVQLHEAARNNDIASLKEMLEQGHDPNSAGEEGRTPLHYAARYGNVSAVDLLLSNGATVSLRDMRGQTALHLAADGGHIDVVQYLLRERKNALLATYFRAEKISVDDKDYGLRTPLHLVAYAGHVEAAEVLLNAGADINLRSASGRTPTHYAAHGNHRHLLELLIARGADIYATDNVTWRTPLQMATENFSFDAMELLQDHGADHYGESR